MQAVIADLHRKRFSTRYFIFAAGQKHRGLDPSMMTT